MARRTLYLPATIAAAVVVALAAASLAASEEAEAAFPGQNGKMVFEMGPYSSYFRPTDIATANPDGTGFLRVTGDGSGDASGTYETDPAFSPDGTLIAFAASEVTFTDLDNVQRTDREIYTVPSAGGTPTRLTDNDVDDANPAFSPDGTKIAFDSVGSLPSGGSTLDVFVMNADGTGLTNLTARPDSQTDPTFSPDGTKIAFVNAGGAFNVSSRSGIFVMPSGGGAPTAVADSAEASETHPSWSPDGAKIAYQRDADIYAVPAAGGTPTSLFTGPENSNEENAFEPAFSPDGTMVAFTKVEAEYETDIYAVPSDGGTPVPLTNNNISSAPDWAPAQSPTPPPYETAPQTTITAGPAAYARSRTASFSFSSEPGSTFRCRVDAGPFLPCSSPKAYQSLPDGRHTFLVAAADATGNADPTPASRTWRVDTARPSGRVTVNGGAATTRSRTVTLSLKASDPAPASGVASMRFKNGGRAWSSWRPYATSSPWTLTAGAGAKTVYVQYRDRAGNVSADAYDRIAHRP